MNAAWIFVSIGDGAADCGDWVALRVMIQMADSINHAIPRLDELETAVSDLIAAGLVESDGSRTRLTPDGCKAFNAARHRHVGHIQRFLELGHAWEDRGFPAVANKTWVLDEDEYRAAAF